MHLSLFIVTTFCIPTAKHVIGGLGAIGRRSTWTSSESLLTFFVSMIWWCLSFDRLDTPVASSTMHLESTWPVSWSRILMIPSIPPMTNVDVSFLRWFIEYRTLGLTRVSHRRRNVLQDRRTKCNSHLRHTQNFYSGNIHKQMKN